MNRISEHHDAQLHGDSCVEVDLDVLASNCRWLRSQLSVGVELHAVIKADAYGHGAAVVAEMLERFGLAERLVVATLSEAQAIAHVSLPITILRPIDLESDDAIEHALLSGWQLTVGSIESAARLSSIARRLRRRALVQLMLDTGLNRCGIEPSAFDAVARAVGEHEELELRCVATHLATADSADTSYAESQLTKFRQHTDAMVIDSRFQVTRAAAATGATFRFRHAQFDAVRIGAGLYGIDPIGKPDASRAVRPTMRWLTRVLTLRTVESGESVGYGRSWTATRRTRVGLAPMGYHDGYPRLASNRGRALVGSVACPVIGKVSMDSVLLDLTDVPEANVGTPVTLLDNDPFGPASMYSLAAASETSPYEILARTGVRLPRKYLPVRTATPERRAAARR